MKRQILIGSVIFIFTFIILIWLMFPYENVALIGLEKIKAKTKANIEYTSLVSGALSTSINGLEVNGIPIGDVKASYSPLSAITKRFSVSSKGTINGEATLSTKLNIFDVQINPVLINSMTDKAEFSGQLTITGEELPLEDITTAVIYSEKAGIETPIGKLDFEKIDAELDIKGDIITITKLTSKDDMELNLKGTIRLNRKRPEFSQANISGTVSVLGTEKEITLKGRLNNIKPSIR